MAVGGRLRRAFRPAAWLRMPKPLCRPSSMPFATIAGLLRRPQVPRPCSGTLLLSERAQGGSPAWGSSGSRRA
eukprot:12188218-Alexandrium_andersonii.AAC.1